MSRVELRRTAKRFRGDDGAETTVIEGLDMEIRSGEFVALVGPSGCGKSTTLRMLAGLETASEGDIFIGDKRVNDLPPKARNVAMVFQSYALYPHMTVFENIAFGPRVRKIPEAEIKRLVGDAARMLGLEDLLERKPAALSGGQRQRVALGRAVVREPSVFLFDEPLSNLDAELRVQMRAEIGRLHSRIGATSVYVTHDQVEAMTMGDRIAVLHRGRLQQFGAPMELYNRPANVFTARFIGTPAMNILRMGRADGALRLGELRLACPPLPAADGEALVGVRCEDVELADADGGASADGTGRFSARVELAEPLGHETIIHARAPGGESVTARVSALRRPPKAGENIALRLNPSRLHFFSAADEKRLEPALADASGRHPDKESNP